MYKTWLLILLVLFLFACKKENRPPSHPTTDGFPVNLTIDQNTPGSPIVGNFEGLSYETGILAESPEILNANNKVLIQLIKNLGPGLLRIGGDSSDETFWTGNGRTAQTGKDSITTSDVDRLAAFSKEIGWPVLFGLNLGYNNSAAAVNEALYVRNSLSTNLYALQAGNEPDVYHLFGLRSTSYTANDYLKDYEAYKSSILAVVPDASFAGPGPAYNTDFIPAFAESDITNVKLLDAHSYITGPASDPSIDINTMLGVGANWKLANVLNVISTESSKFHIPYRITECNSIYGGGKKGVSDVFASALWALDFMWTVAINNGQGVNFHGGNGLIYSPVMIENGITTAMPEYYAMLAFKYGSNGRVVAVNNDQPGYNCSNYVCVNADNTWSVTLINKGNVSLSFTVKRQQIISTIQVARLTAPSITSTTGTTFAGSTVNADGTFTPAPEQKTINEKSFAVTVPAGSAAVITVK